MTTTSTSGGQEGEAWPSEAQPACYGNPEPFYDDHRIESAPHIRAEREAKALCADCPIRNACLTWAIKHKEEYGIWGGLSPEERANLRKRKRKVAA